MSSKPKETKSSKQLLISPLSRLFTKLGNRYRKLVDWFYPPFGKFVGLQFFRYVFCGVTNVAFDWILYFITYNFVVRKEMIDIFFVTISPHVMSLLITFPITLLFSFLLQKYVTFTTSNTEGLKQFFRYIMVVAINLMINYIGLKILVDHLGIYPTPSKMIITIFTTIVGYIAQKLFIFQIKKSE